MLQAGGTHVCNHVSAHRYCPHCVQCHCDVSGMHQCTDVSWVRLGINITILCVSIECGAVGMGVDAVASTPRDVAGVRVACWVNALGCRDNI